MLIRMLPYKLTHPLFDSSQRSNFFMHDRRDYPQILLQTMSPGNLDSDHSHGPGVWWPAC